MLMLCFVPEMKSGEICDSMAQVFNLSDGRKNIVWLLLLRRFSLAVNCHIFWSVNMKKQTS